MSNEIKILNVTKKKQKYAVETSKKTYLFHEDTIIQYYLFKDKVFTEDEFLSILDAEAIIDLYSKALKFLSYQSRSTKEMRTFLSSKTDNAEHQNEVLMKIQNLGYLDDEKFASDVLDYELRHQKGPKVIVNKLKQKGISDYIINKIVLKYDESQESIVLDDIVNKLSQRNQDEPLLKQKQIIFQKLLRDGFSQSLILDALSKVSFIDNSEQVLQNEIDKLQRRYQHLPSKEGNQKIIRHLMTKGYSYSIIQTKLKEKTGD
ncbi:MAG: RecX family transcriptional regulator [Bacilli bacterium]